jgi:hypothetical protein
MQCNHVFVLFFQACQHQSTPVNMSQHLSRYSLILVVEGVEKATHAGINRG